MLTIEDLIHLVHVRGLWQDEKCYITKCEEYRNIICIYNHYVYENEEIVHDCITIDINNEHTFGRLCSVEIGQINKFVLKNWKELFDISYYKEFLIPLKENKYE